MEEGTQARKVSGSSPDLAPQGVASPREFSHYLDGQYIQPDSPGTILSKGVHLSRRGTASMAWKTLERLSLEYMDGTDSTAWLTRTWLVLNR